MGPREPPPSLLPPRSLTSLVLSLSIILNAAAGINRSRRQLSLSDLVRHSLQLLPVDGYVRIRRSSPCPAWQNTCFSGTPGGLPWPCSHTGTHVWWPGHLWSEPHGLSHGKSMVSFVAGQGADHVRGRTPVFCQCNSCKRMELDTTWLDDPVTYCYLGEAIITMFLGSLWWFSLQLGLGRESGR